MATRQLYAEELAKQRANAQELSKRDDGVAYVLGRSPRALPRRCSSSS